MVRGWSPPPERRGHPEQDLSSARRPPRAGPRRLGRPNLHSAHLSSDSSRSQRWRPPRRRHAAPGSISIDPPRQTTQTLECVESCTGPPRPDGLQDQRIC
eukprot:4242325-Prymnesium_polylepis.2